MWALFALIHIIFTNRFEKTCDYFSELHNNIKPEYLAFTPYEMSKMQAIQGYLLVCKVCIFWWRPISSFSSDLYKLVVKKQAYKHFVKYGVFKNGN